MKIKMMQILILLFGCSYTVISQSLEVEIPDSLPKNLEIDKSTPQTYKMTTDYFDYDLQANFIKKARIVGNFTCYLQNDSVKWNNVYISESKRLNDPFPKGKKQMAFENFEYIQSNKVLNEQFFSLLPNIDFRLKNLVWDMIGFYALAYPNWNSLKLNTIFYSNDLNGEVNLSNNGTFENKEMQLKWIGVSKIHGEQCAIIKYSQMNGKLKVDLENMSMKGRSHYWGEIYVSLIDKQIEYASLKEDVITDVLFKGQNNNILGYTVRNITLEKR